MTRSRIALAVLLLAFPAWLGAAEVYLGGGVGDEMTESDAGALFEDFTRQGGDDSQKLYLGIGWGRYFAVEGSYYDLGGRSCCPELADAGYVSSVDGLSLAGVGRWPLGRFELFGKAGMLQWEESGEMITIAGPQPFTTDGSDLLFGAGGAVRLLEHLAARVEWEAFDLGEDSADTVWLLLELRF